MTLWCIKVMINIINPGMSTDKRQINIVIMSSWETLWLHNLANKIPYIHFLYPLLLSRLRGAGVYHQQSLCKTWITLKSVTGTHRRQVRQTTIHALINLTYVCFWSVGRNRSPWRRPTGAQGELHIKARRQCLLRGESSNHCTIMKLSQSPVFFLNN